MKTDQVFDLTDAHSQALKQMVFLWIEAEAGAPGMPGYRPIFNYTDLNHYTDLGRTLGIETDPASFSPAEQKRVEDFHVSLGTALEIALSVTPLSPGDYSYPNYFAGFQDPSVIEPFMPPKFIPWDDHSSEYEAVPVPQGPTISFHLTDQHLTLARALRVDWGGFNSYTGINFKRPYGDMTYIELDMAALLGIPLPSSEAQGKSDFTEEQLRVFHQLHTDMLYVVPLILWNSSLPSGRYTLHDDRWILNP